MKPALAVLVAAGDRVRLPHPRQRLVELLREHRGEVIEVPGSELARAGAAAHALCCPIARDAVH